MKVTYNWLKDFVDIKISPQELADKLTMAGLEVTGLEGKDGDFIFEIEITSNRPDWLSVVGIAREVAAVINSKFKIQNSKLIKFPRGGDSFKLVIEDKKDCPLYTAKIIRNVKVGLSPEWIRKRLELVGCRSVNNVVDITNYILLERGEPLHAFDLDRLKGDKIIVRRAQKGEKLITIDDKERNIDENILIIADNGGPVAAAGIMGAKFTEVTAETKNILLEAAIFNPVLIRRGRQFLGMQSESSYRFERGIDIQTAIDASCYALGLIREFCGGSLAAAKTSGRIKTKNKIINLDNLTANRILGVDIKPAQAKNILSSLGFRVKNKGKNKFAVEVPSHRADVSLEIDLIEEVARIFGYEFIIQTLPSLKPTFNRSAINRAVPLIKNDLIGLGLSEVITHSLVDKNYLQSFPIKNPKEDIEIANPISQDQEILRSTLIPSLGRCIARNLNQRQTKVNIFEIAKVFSMVQNKPEEELVLGIGMVGENSLLLEQGLVKDKIGIPNIKGVIEKLFASLGVKAYSFILGSKGYTIEIKLKGQIIGFIMQLGARALDKLDIKSKDVFISQLNLERILPFVDLERKFVPLPLYPEITRDISFIVREEISVQDIIDAVKEKAGFLLWQVKVSDYYKGKQIPPGFKGLTISCIYRSKDRTLTESEINPLHFTVSYLLAERFGVKIR